MAVSIIAAFVINIIIVIVLLNVLLTLFHHTRARTNPSSTSWLTEATIRKLFHITIGPTFVLAWSLFPRDEHLLSLSSRYWAALVPFLAALYFILVSKGVVQNQLLIAAATPGTLGLLHVLPLSPLLHVHRCCMK
jgi:hypothetical protein